MLVHCSKAPYQKYVTHLQNYIAYNINLQGQKIKATTVFIYISLILYKYFQMKQGLYVSLECPSLSQGIIRHNKVTWSWVYQQIICK